MAASDASDPTDAPDPSGDALARALAQRTDGDLAGAIETLRAAAAADLSDPALALNLGKMLAESGQLDRAEPWFRHALKLAPDDLDLRLAYGTWLGQCGRIEEAKEHLTAVMQDLDLAADHAALLGDHDAVLEVRRFLGATAVNLGRAALESGDPALALSFARAWLDDAEHGDAARELVVDALDSDALDPQRLAELSLEDGRVTPAVVALLVDSALGREPPDWQAIEHTLALADDVLPAGWRHSDEALERVLTAARARFGHALMRARDGHGALDERAFPALLATAPHPLHPPALK